MWSAAEAGANWLDGMETGQIDELLARWEAAEQARIEVARAFDRALHLYVVGEGPAPDGGFIKELVAAHLFARHRLTAVHMVLRQLRASVPLL